MRSLGIDFGTKKVGIAISDELGAMAFPRAVLPNDTDLLKKIESIVQDENVAEVVIGHSLDLEGKENPLHALVQEFITDLTLACGIPIHLEPEQFSTQQATRIQGKDAMTDAAAAALILEAFLARRRPGSAFDDLNT